MTGRERERGGGRELTDTTLPCRQQKLEEVEKHEILTRHPNCLMFVKAWEERGLLYIQTELCQMRYCVCAHMCAVSWVLGIACLRVLIHMDVFLRVEYGRF